MTSSEMGGLSWFIQNSDEDLMIGFINLRNYELLLRRVIIIPKWLEKYRQIMIQCRYHWG